MKLKNILVPTDLTDMAVEAINYAAQLAGTFDGTVHLLTVLEVPLVPASMPPAIPYVYDRDAIHDDAMNELGKLQATLCCKSQREAIYGLAVDEIIRYAENKDIDAIVMVTHGRKGLSRAFLGSTTEAVIRRAPCPVISIRPGKSVKQTAPETFEKTHA